MKYQITAHLKYASAVERNAAALYALQSGSIEGFPNDFLYPSNSTDGSPSLDFVLTYAAATEEPYSSARDAVYDYFAANKDKCVSGTLRKIIINFDTGGMDELEFEESWGEQNA